MPKPRQVRLGAAGTCTLTPLASSAPRQRSSSSSTLQGEQTDRVTRGPGGTPRGGGRRASALTLRAPRPAGQGRGRGPCFRQPAGTAERTQPGYAPLRPPAPRRRRKRRARRRHSGRADPSCAAAGRRRRSPPRWGRFTASLSPATTER